MPRTLHSKRHPGPPDPGLELQFEREVRRLPAGARPRLLPWLRRWRRRPRRVFWVVDAAGHWRRL